MDDDTYDKVMMSVCWFDILTYSGVLIFAVRNSYRYLIQQKRYREFHLTLFYILTVLIAVFRIIFFAMFIRYLKQGFSDGTLTLFKVTQNLAFTFKGVLGAF